MPRYSYCTVSTKYSNTETITDNATITLTDSKLRVFLIPIIIYVMSKIVFFSINKVQELIDLTICILIFNETNKTVLLKQGVCTLTHKTLQNSYS